MKTELKDYQVKALKDFSRKYEAITDDRHEMFDIDPVRARRARWGIQVTAPTGAGKTVLAGEIIDRHLGGHIVLVLSPGSGDLEEQTTRSLQRMLPGRVQKLSGTILQTLPLAVGDVYVSNWEALVSTRDKSNAYITTMSKDAEQRNIWDWLDAIGAALIPFAIVIDESHHGAKSAAGSINVFLKDITRHLGYTPFFVELSATPAAREQQYIETGGRLDHVSIPVVSVVKAGMIRRAVVLNWGVQTMLDDMTADEIAGQDAEASVLRRALATRDELELEYKRIGSPYTPALGIQLPSSKEGMETRERLENILFSIKNASGNQVYYYDRDNEPGTVAVYMDKDKRGDFANIAAVDSPIKVFFYKQGITMGWDCPRAQILVGYRHLQSRVFEKQNLGRFLRTTEHKHYNHDLLDLTFVYTNMQDVDLGAAGFQKDLEVTGGAYGDIQRRRMFEFDGMQYKALAAFEALGLKSQTIQRSHPELVTRSEAVRVWNSEADIDSWYTQLVAPTFTVEHLVGGQIATEDLGQQDDTNHAQLNQFDTGLAYGLQHARKELNDKLLADTRHFGGERFKPAAGVYVARLLEHLDAWAQSAMRLRRGANTPDLSALAPQDRRVDIPGYIAAFWSYPHNYALLRVALERMVKEIAVHYPPRQKIEYDDEGNRNVASPATSYKPVETLYAVQEWQEVIHADYNDGAEQTSKTYQGKLVERNAWGPELAGDDVYRVEKTSGPELKFEQYFAALPNLIDFAKNSPAGGNVFSRVYATVDDEVKNWRTVEPDYIIEYGNLSDVRVLIAEVKDTDGGLDTQWRQKAQSLANLQAEYSDKALLCGVVRPAGSGWVISQRINGEMDYNIDLDLLLKNGVAS